MRFLRILFLCHARADRSFTYKGKQFPICARCSGNLCGLFLGVVWTALYGIPGIFASLALMLPLVVDGTLQALTKYESNNAKRFVTGLAFGVAMVFVLIHHHLLAVSLAKRLLDLLGVSYV